MNNKVVLITGGTGSFGKAVLKRLLAGLVREVRVFSRDEKKQEDLRIELNDPRVKFYIGDVRDLASVSNAMKGVSYVFHAAALKQVPSCEFYPMQAYQTNVVGTDNVITAATAALVEKVVFLSTDKAVYPINAMGISKAMAEKVVVARSREQLEGETILCWSRYGNVMGSRGSVIPLFVKQIKSGMDLTLTDPSMTRFLMSLEESVDLVLFAFSNASQGDIFVQKAPASTVEDLAISLKEIFSSHAELKVIGTRHGEKLYESLISREEMVKAEDLGEYYRIPADNRDLNYAQYFSEGSDEVSASADYTSHNTRRLSVNEVKVLLSSLSFIKEELNA